MPKLEEIVGEYEMSVVPRSLCSVDGSLYVSTDKSSLIHAIEEYPALTIQPDQLSDKPPVGHPSRVIIVDVMALLQGMKKH